jgi:excinuclease ABC subunit B
MSVFRLQSDWPPAGDQPKAIENLVKGLKKGMRKQTLLGVTGSGKTYTCANVIAQHDKPTLVIAHNKTLAAQLAQEYREFFPDAAVHYFVSYYDFYQPEAYLPVSDTYIEKDAQINEEIDRLRHASTQALLSRKDVIIVASVSCIYGLGSPEQYREQNLQLSVGMKIGKTDVMRKLIGNHFERTTADVKSAQFRAVGNRVDVVPVSETYMYQIFFT